jgi:hypothetical protein
MLHAQGIVAEADIFADGTGRIIGIVAAGEALGLNVAKRGVDGSDRCHGDWAATPVSAFVEVLPDVFNAARIAADEAAFFLRIFEPDCRVPKNYRI